MTTKMTAAKIKAKFTTENAASIINFPLLIGGIYHKFPKNNAIISRADYL